MSLFQRTFTPLRTASRAALPQSYKTAAKFSTTSSQKALSESDVHHENRDGKIEEHKQDSISKAKKGDAEWKPELASNSEQAVQGEKSDKSMKEMEKMGEEQAKKK